MYKNFTDDPIFYQDWLLIKETAVAASQLLTGPMFGIKELNLRFRSLPPQLRGKLPALCYEMMVDKKIWHVFIGGVEAVSVQEEQEHLRKKQGRINFHGRLHITHLLPTDVSQEYPRAWVVAEASCIEDCGSEASPQKPGEVKTGIYRR